MPSWPHGQGPSYYQETPRCSSPTVTSEAGLSDHEPTSVSASVKILRPNEKQSEHKVFILRDINVDEITTLALLRDEIYAVW